MKPAENIDHTKLNNIPKNEGMTIPNDFFVKFPLQMEARIDQYEKEKAATFDTNNEEMEHMNHFSSKKYRLRNFGVRFVAVAAVACLLIFSLSWFNIVFTDSESTSNMIATVENNDQTFTEEWMLASVSDYDIMEVVYYGTE